MRTRFIQFNQGKRVLNPEELESGDPEVVPMMSLRVTMEVQFARPEDHGIMDVNQFRDQDYSGSTKTTIVIANRRISFSL